MGPGGVAEAGRMKSRRQAMIPGNWQRAAVKWERVLMPSDEKEVIWLSK
jgi:hypothetical protein